MDPSTYLPTIEIGHFNDVEAQTQVNKSDNSVINHQSHTAPSNPSPNSPGDNEHWSTNTSTESSPPAPFPDLDLDLYWQHSPAFDQEFILRGQPELLELPPPVDGDDGGTDRNCVEAGCVPIRIVWIEQETCHEDDEQGRIAEANANALRSARAMFGRCEDLSLGETAKPGEKIIQTTESYENIDKTDS